MRVKPSKKQSKIHAMQPEQLLQILDDMRFSLADLARVTGIPYRTLQDYAYGLRSIPARVAERLKLEQIREKKIRQSVYKNIERDIARMYPAGIKSEAEET